MFSPGALVKVNVVYFGLGYAVLGDYKVQENKNNIKEYKCQIVHDVLIRKKQNKTGGSVKGRQAITKEGKKDKCCELNQQRLINTIKLGIEMET